MGRSGLSQTMITSGLIIIAAAGITHLAVPGSPAGAATAPRVVHRTVIRRAEPFDPRNSLSRIKRHAILTSIKVHENAIAARKARRRRQEEKQHRIWLAAQQAQQQQQQTSLPVSQSSVASAPPASGGNGSPPASFTSCVISRESGGDPTAVNPASTASGLFGIEDPLWDEFNSTYSAAYLAPSSVQYGVFDAIYAADGAAPWAPYDGC